MTPMASSAPPRRSTAARPSDDELLDAAVVVFSQVGFNGAAMEQIATAGNTTKPTLYAHFGNKECLYRACLDREADAFATSLFNAYERAAGLPLDRQVHADMTAFFDYTAKHPDSFRLLFGPEQTAQSSQTSKRFLDAVRFQVAQRVQDYNAEHGIVILAEAARMSAAMLVGIAVHGAQHALQDGQIGLTEAGEIAAAFATAAIRNVDLTAAK